MITFSVPAGVSTLVFQGEHSVLMDDYVQYLDNVWNLDKDPPTLWAANSPFNKYQLSSFDPGTKYQITAKEAFDIIT